MRITNLAAAICVAVLFIGCSAEDKSKTAFINGTFTVSDSIDTSKNFSGIGLTIIKKDSANADADTLFHQITDSTGSLVGEAQIPEKRQYTALLSRNERNLARFGVILAEGDTVNISGELPDLENTIEIQSREHDAMETYRRVSKGYQRIAAFAQAGRLTGDSLSTELNKWSNLFWEVYEKNKGTLASEVAAAEAVRLLEGWNNEAMMQKIRSVQDKDEFISLGATYGKSYLASSEGLDYALSYLDTLQNNAKSEDTGMRVKMEQIKLL